MEPTYIGDWEKINDFQFRHRYQRNSFIDITLNGVIYYDTTKVDIQIPILAFTKNPITSPNGYAELDETGKLKRSQIPERAITNTHVVIDEESMLALEVEQGDIAIRADLSKTFILRIEPASELSNWEEMKNPLAPVQSVAGKIGNVVLESSDITDLGSNAEMLYRKNTANGYSGLDENSKLLEIQIPNSIERISNKGVANGYAELDANGKVPVSRIIYPVYAGKILGEKFYSEFYPPISPSFPAICLSRLSDADTKTDFYTNTNIPNLFSPLLSTKWKFNNLEQISYSGYTIAAQTVVTLTAANNTLINDPFLQAVREMIYYHNSLDRATALVTQNYIDLDLVILFKGVYCRLIGFNLTTRTVTLDYSTIGQTTGSGNIEIFPYRLPETNIEYLTKIQIRKLAEETALASGYNSGLNLENRIHGHRHNIDIPYSAGGIGSLYVINSPAAAITTNGTFLIKSEITDGTNGTPRTGRTTRSNQSQSKLYIWTEVYNA